MNFKKAMTFGMTGFIFLFGFSQVNAAAEVKEFDSNATVEFEVGTGIPGVVDPIDPSKPLDPIEPGNPPTDDNGPLTLDYVSFVDFGEHEIEGQTAVYESTNLKPFIQVTDRRGTGAGWNVTATVTEFSNGEKATLPGSKLAFSNGEAASTSVLTKPIPNTNVELVAGGDAVNVVTAEEGVGLGTWVNRWLPSESDAVLNNNVTLEVPTGAATLGKHTATITWSLADAPGQ